MIGWDPAKLPMRDRFEFSARLGAGGFGDVYRAHDGLRGEDVAVKILRHIAPLHLQMLKREFRSLADVVHPNLVSLHELVSDGADWCITMEFVDGVDLLTEVHGARDTEEDPAMWTPTVEDPSVRSVTDVRRRAVPAPLRLDVDKVRSVFRQIAEAIAALHAAGKLHRDIKPSNILVTPSGRAVVLDFGLVMELSSGAADENDGLGTVAYMSPEQAQYLPLDAASDWYSFGVTLFEVLTGRLPFDGTPSVVLSKKSTLDAPDPAALSPDVPRDLTDLCARLLARDPGARPDGAAVLRALGSATVPSPPRVAPPAALLGRDPERAVLQESFGCALGGRAVMVMVSGPSGIGKSALVQHHVDELARADGAFVLQGRCYERESVPYKALDGVIDALVRALRDVDEGRLVGRLFATAVALARLFPAFRSLPALANLVDEKSARAVDPWELRRVAATGLCAAIATVARKRPLVLCIDDLQWADADSAELLKEFFRARGGEATQFVVSFRPEGRADSPCLRLLLDADLGLETREVAVGPLAPELAARLAATGLEGGDDAETVRRIARESGGNPFFVQELNRHVREASQGGAALDGDLSLDAVMLGRVARLGPDARRLVEVVALAGGTIPAPLAFRAAGVARSHKTLAQLRWGSLVRSVGADGALLAPYHDRVREAVAGSLSPTRTRALHASLAAAWESAPGAEPEVLLTHHRLAGSLAEAARYAAVAAARASDALAFDHAARLYRLALSLDPPGAPERRRLQFGLARALADAGRGAESGAAYLSSADDAAPAEQLERRRLAAEQLLRAGYIDEGLAVATRVLEAVGVTLPATPGRGLLRLLMHRARLWTRGLDFAERPAAQCDPDELARFDACWSVATGLAIVDTTRAAALQSYSLLLALDLGEPSRVARALATEVGFSSTDGLGAQARTAVLVERSRGLARRVGDANAAALAEVMAGLAAWCEGRWPDVRALTGEALAQLDAGCNGVSWERGTATILHLDALFYLGGWAELAERVAPMIAEAQERGDLYTATVAHIRFECFAGLIADDPARSTRALARARQWSNAAFHSIHLVELHETTEVALYRGAAAEAWGGLTAAWGELERSMLLQVQAFRVQMRFLRARAALAASAAAREGRGGRRLREARSDAERLEGERTPWSDALALLVRAGVAAREGDRGRELASLDAAARGFDGAAMGMHAAVARRQRGLLLGGVSGAALVTEAEQWMTAQRVARPEGIAALLAPAAGSGA